MFMLTVRWPSYTAIFVPNKRCDGMCAEGPLVLGDCADWRPLTHGQSSCRVPEGTTG
jgi:hypothetical protein